MSICSLTVIAQLRLYAMYSCNRKLLLAMVAAVTLSFGVQGPILLIMVVKAKSTSTICPLNHKLPI